MKTLFFGLTFAFVATISASAQTFLTRTGKINFDASTKNSPEKVEAKSNEVASIVDAKTGDVRFQVLIRSFKFERALMQEHFNENYMESDKFPKADFKGAITNLNEINFSKDGNYNAKVSGKLTIHGVTNDVTVPGTIAVKGNTVEIKTKFIVKLADYNLTVPAVVADKLDKMATVTIESQLTQK
jgi:polyisoprenoid-binding protein YceI